MRTVFRRRLYVPGEPHPSLSAVHAIVVLFVVAVGASLVPLVVDP
jgi:hypothetical protein